MNGRGFLGTNATVLADLSLSLGVLVALTLTAGVLLAVFKRYRLHRWVQSAAVAINLAQVLTIMIASFLKSAAPGIPQKLGQTYYMAAVAHGLLGAATLLFGTFVALRGNELVPRALKFNNYKLFMRTAYGMYLAATALGIWVYSAWYINPAAPPAGAEAQAQPVEQRSDELTVPMANFVFNPTEVIVPVGTTVIWVNQDGAPHTATADDGKLFKSDLLARGQSFRHTFGQVGEFPYFCELHGSAGGQDMAGVIKVVPAGQAPALAAAAPAIAAPTPQPTPGPLPAKFFGQPAGTAAFRDARARNDQIVINLRADAPPAGEALYAFLTTQDSSATQPLGPLTPDAGATTGAFTAPDGTNLAARFDRFVITREPAGANPTKPGGPIIFEGRLPGQASHPLSQLLVDGPGLPARQGYATGIRLQTDELARHARFIADARAAGDLAGVKRHAEHVYNLIVGSLGPKFGDLNGDGHAQNPGDGFGLLQNGTQLGYLRAAGDAATAAKNTPDATDAIKVHAEHVLICTQNMQEWSIEARDLALQLTQAGDIGAAQQPTDRLTTLSQWIVRGDDANGDGEIAPIPGEGGALVAYEHAQFMAGFGLFPAGAAGAPGQPIAFAIYPVAPANDPHAAHH